MASKAAAISACIALLQGDSSSRDKLELLASHFNILKILPRIDKPLDDIGSNLVNASHVVRDFLFIGAGSRGSNCIMAPSGAPQLKSSAFFKMNNIKFVINVARELCPPSPSFTHDLPFEDLSYPHQPDLIVTRENLQLVSSAPPSHSIVVHIPMKDEDAWCASRSLPVATLTLLHQVIRTGV
jgi:hypothetical protein